MKDHIMDNNKKNNLTASALHHTQPTFNNLCRCQLHSLP